MVGSFVQTTFADHIFLTCASGKETIPIPQRPKQMEFYDQQVEGFVENMQRGDAILCYRCQSKIEIDAERKPRDRHHRLHLHLHPLLLLGPLGRQAGAGEDRERLMRIEGRELPPSVTPLVSALLQGVLLVLLFEHRRDRSARGNPRAGTALVYGSLAANFARVQILVAFYGGDPRPLAGRHRAQRDRGRDGRELPRGRSSSASHVDPSLLDDMRRIVGEFAARVPGTSDRDRLRRRHARACLTSSSSAADSPVSTPRAA